MAAPTMTMSAHGNAKASGSLAANTTASAFTVDFSTALYGGRLQVWTTGGTVAVTNGLQVSVYATADTTPSYDTVPYVQFVVATPTSATARRSIDLPTGLYAVVLKNLDVTNAITTEASTATIA